MNRPENPIVWMAVMPGEDLVFQGGEKPLGGGVRRISRAGNAYIIDQDNRVFKLPAG